MHGDGVAVRGVWLAREARGRGANDTAPIRLGFRIGIGIGIGGSTRPALP